MARVRRARIAKLFASRKQLAASRKAIPIKKRGFSRSLLAIREPARQNAEPS
jgi:hypothetical protein